jgi:hypothetical protein
MEAFDVDFTFEYGRGQGNPAPYDQGLGQLQDDDGKTGLV